MAFASSAERAALRSTDFSLDFVLRVRKNGRESEIACDDLNHALELSGQWVKVHGAEYVEIFRVLPDGSLNPTIGPA